ncbi:DUF6444 domain-containing protein [Caedibacter taeniospiralis]
MSNLRSGYSKNSRNSSKPPSSDGLYVLIKAMRRICKPNILFLSNESNNC